MKAENLVRIGVKLAAPAGWIVVMGIIFWWSGNERADQHADSVRQTDALVRIADLLEKRCEDSAEK